MTAADLPAEKVAALVEVLRWVQIGPFGPNALDIIKAGGVTHLNSSERADFAEALAPLIAGWLGEARRAAQVPAVFLTDDHEECDKAERAARSKGIEAGYSKGRADGAAEVRARVEAVCAESFTEDEAGAHVVYVWELRAALDGER